MDCKVKPIVQFDCSRLQANSKLDACLLVPVFEKETIQRFVMNSTGMCEHTSCLVGDM